MINKPLGFIRGELLSKYYLWMNCVPIIVFILSTKVLCSFSVWVTPLKSMVPWWAHSDTDFEVGKTAVISGTIAILCHFSN